MSLGDFDTSAVVYFKFTTFRASTGSPYTLAGTPVLSVYKDSSTTQTTTGVTLTVDFDSVTGLNHVAVDTSADGTFYSAGSFFDVVITTGTVDSVSAVGSVVGRFTLRKTACLKPTTSGRTLDVSSGGEAGIDFANIGSPTTTVNLSGTTISTSQVVASVTNRVTANTDQWNAVSVTGMPMPTYTQPTGFLAATFPTTVASTTNITAAGGVTLASSQTFSTTGSVGSVTASVTVGTNNDKTGYSLNTAPLTAAQTAAAVWNALLSSYDTADTFGGHVIRSVNSNNELQITGSNHAAADVHETQPGSIHATTFDAGAIDAAALATDAVNEIANGLLDLTNGIETGLTLRQAMRLDTAALVGKLSGAEGTTVTIRNVGDTTNRIVATVDADGNRTAVTTDAT